MLTKTLILQLGKLRCMGRRQLTANTWFCRRRVRLEPELLLSPTTYWTSSDSLMYRLRQMNSHRKISQYLDSTYFSFAKYMPVSDWVGFLVIQTLLRQAFKIPRLCWVPLFYTYMTTFDCPLLLLSQLAITSLIVWSSSVFPAGLYKC